MYNTRPNNVHLSPLEQLCDSILDRRVRQRNLPPQTLQELFFALQNKWQNIPQRPIKNLVASIRADPLSYFSFQPVLHDWCNKGRGMCYPVCGMVHIKEPLLLIDKSSLCGGSGFPFSLSEWSLTICLTPYNRR